VSDERNWGALPAELMMNSPCGAEAANRSTACRRYSQLAQPAQAKMARMKRTTPKTSVLRFKGIDLFALLYGPPAVGPTNFGHYAEGVS
jgi:hypothetical protein